MNKLDKERWVQISLGIRTIDSFDDLSSAVQIKIISEYGLAGYDLLQNITREAYIAGISRFGTYVFRQVPVGFLDRKFYEDILKSSPRSINILLNAGVKLTDDMIIDVFKKVSCENVYHHLPEISERVSTFVASSEPTALGLYNPNVVYTDKQLFEILVAMNGNDTFIPPPMMTGFVESRINPTDRASNDYYPF